MAMRWRWPPESFTPRSPTWASRPIRPCGSVSVVMNSAAWARRAASQIAASSASGLP